MREFTTWTVILLLAFGMLGFGWLTRHPDVAWLERAEDWPVMGPLAERFRRAYLGPPADERPAAAETDGGPEIVIVRPPEPEGPLRLPRSYYESEAQRGTRGGAAGASGPPGSPVAVGDLVPEPNASSGAEKRTAGTALPPLVALDSEPPIRRLYPRRWLIPGTVLRAEPDPGAAEVDRARELANVPLLEERGGWLRVRLRGREGWADPSTPLREALPPGRGALAGRHLAQPRTRVLKQVREILGLREPNGSLGPYPLYTDVEDEKLLALLGGVAERLDDAYSARYGLAVPKRRSGPVIALFASEQDFRTVAASSTVSLENPRGFAAGGLAVFYVGDDSRPTVVTGFVHELTHTLNRHALGVSLPPWLEEGLAEDLGTVWLEDPDAPAPGLTATAVPGRPDWMVQGILVASADGRPGVAYEMLAMLGETEFFSVRSRLHYAHSLLFVRCLLDGGDGELAAGFRDFLGAVGAGLPPTPARLSDRLGRDWPEIERTCAGHRQELAAEGRTLLPAGLELAAETRAAAR